MIVYTLLSSFVWPWSDFILPQLLLKEKDLYTVAVGLMSLGDDEFARFAGRIDVYRGADHCECISHFLSS